MNAAQLQNTTHLEPIIVYTWPSRYNRQLASSLVWRYYSYVYTYELGSGIKHGTQHVERVLKFHSQNCFVCPWLSYSGVTLWVNKVHTLTDNVYIQMSK